MLDKTTNAEDNGDNLIKVRRYGSAGPAVMLLHGGPGAPGYMAPVARELQDSFTVFEPFQRGSSPDEPLSVDKHIEDLHAVIDAYCGGEKPHIVGHSWGAMLALAYSAAHPQAVRSLVMIGCGTFDKDARAKLLEVQNARMTDDFKRRLGDLEKKYPDESVRIGVMGKMFQRLYAYELLPANELAAFDAAEYDAKAHTQTWDDMVRQQELGVYPASFEKIVAPAIMLHGDHDVHPSEMIFKSLRQHIPHLEYEHWEKCGHDPWLERHVREDFFKVLKQWLSEH